MIKPVFRCEWDNVLKHNEGNLKFGASNLNSELELDLHNINPNDVNSKTKSGSNYDKFRGLTYKESFAVRMNSTSSKDRSETSVSFEPLLKGKHTIPFSFRLPGDTLESIEGIEYLNGVSYFFTAKLERNNGFKSKPWIVQKPIRIIRTLPICFDNFLNFASATRQWDNILEYQIDLATKIIPIGGSAKVKILAIPMVKKLRVLKVSVSIIQYQNFYSNNEKLFSNRRPVVNHIFKNNSELESPDQWLFEETIPIPSSISRIMPSYELGGVIEVFHKMKYEVIFQNEDGKYTQLRGHFPVTLVISSQFPVTGRKATLFDEHFVNALVYEQLFPGNSICTSTNDMDLGILPTYETSFRDELILDREIANHNDNTRISTSSEESATVFAAPTYLEATNSCDQAMVSNSMAHYKPLELVTTYSAPTPTYKQGSSPEMSRKFGHRKSISTSTGDANSTNIIKANLTRTKSAKVESSKKSNENGADNVFRSTRTRKRSVVRKLVCL